MLTEFSQVVDKNQYRDPKVDGVSKAKDLGT